MRTLCIVAASLFLTAGPSLASTLPVTIHLKVKPDHEIPCMPPTMVMRVTNLSSEPLGIPAARLEVTQEVGDPFFPKAFDGAIAVFEEHWKAVPPIAPKSTIDLELAPFGSIVSWLDDERLSKAGRFVFRIHLLERTDGPRKSAVSNPVTFTVDEPTGADAAAWALKRSLVGEGCRGIVWASMRIRSVHPQSRYAWLHAEISPDRSPEENIAILQEVIAKDRGFRADAFRFLVAEERYRQFTRSLPGSTSPPSLESAIAANELYVAALRELIDSKDPHVRHKATQALDGAPSTAQVRQVYEESAEVLEEIANPTSPGKVKPFVECVEPEGKKLFTAIFGYLGPNSGPVTIPIGDDNRFNPKPRDRGQPSQFQSGDHHRVFKVRHVEGELTWKVGSKEATASLKGSERCRKDDDDHGDDDDDDSDDDR